MAHEIYVYFDTGDHIRMECTCGEFKWSSENDISVGITLKEMIKAAEEHLGGPVSPSIDSTGEDGERQNLVGRSWLR